MNEIECGDAYQMNSPVELSRHCVMAWNLPHPGMSPGAPLSLPSRRQGGHRGCGNKDNFPSVPGLPHVPGPAVSPRRFFGVRRQVPVICPSPFFLVKLPDVLGRRLSDPIGAELPGFYLIYEQSVSQSFNTWE
ncbi:hypothetical protein RUM43_005836 [Polyplax serrata]|uniref:Uncharacterized protein n=1 Tax=Polyplax serrata TaxID=468196 RepID=A0AAN8NWR8_POLSC